MNTDSNGLTHWPLEDLNEIFKLTLVTDGWVISCEIPLS